MQRFALIGAGFIGAVHARNLAADPGVDFRFVTDLDTSRAETIAAAHGARAVSLEVAFDPNEVDAVLIASSTDTHASNLRRAAAAGIAAFVEKPIDLDLDRATEVVREVEAAGVPAMVDFNRRFDRDHAALQGVVADGGIGSLQLLQLTSRGPELPPIEYLRVSGGQMRDQAVHFFDLARWISGDEVVEVHAMGAALADPRVAEVGDVDTSATTLRLSGGAIVQIDCLRRTGYGYDERIEAAGSEGLVESARMRSGGVTRFAGTRAESDGLHAGWFERVQPTYAASLRSFVEALDRGTPVGATLRDGLAAQAIAEAATRSLASGRTESVARD